MSNSIIRFITGEPEEPRKRKQADIESLAKREVQKSEFIDFAMELDHLTTRRAMDRVAEMHQYRVHKANGDPELDAQLRMIQVSYTVRQARRLRGDQ